MKIEHSRERVQGIVDFCERRNKPQMTLALYDVKNLLVDQPFQVDEKLLGAARAVATVLGVDYDEICTHEKNDDAGFCESGTCPGALSEDHDAEFERERLKRMASAAIRSIW